MIFPFDQYKIYLAPQPADFRKGMDGLAAIVQSEFEPDPFCGAIFIFLSKRSDRMKAILWDGTGLILIYKRIEGSGFVWPAFRNGTISISKTQFEALFEGIDWRRVTGPVSELCRPFRSCRRATLTNIRTVVQHLYFS